MMRRLMQARGWLPEGLVIAAALALRLGLVARYDPRWGPDAESHVANVAWYAAHRTLPPLAQNRVAYHPPLFYVVAAGLLHATGHGHAALLDAFASTATTPPLRILQALALVTALLRLLASACLLRRLFPERWQVRTLTLAVLAVLPAAMQVDLTITNECLSTLFAVLAMLALASLLRDPPGRAAGWWAAALGMALALGLLSKYSGMVMAAAAALAGVLELAWGRARTGPRLRHALLAAGIVVLGAGWFYAGNVARHGTLTPHRFAAPGWDREQFLATGASERPYLRRRPPGYVLGWDTRIFTQPFYPTASDPDQRGTPSRFFPVLVASTFVDHYNFGLGRDPEAGRLPDDRPVNGWPVRPAVVAAARVAMACGTLIALTTAAAFFLAMLALWRRRDVAALAMLSVPLLALLGQLHFAVQFPVDREGMVKGSYLQIAALPLAALFASALAWLWRRPLGRLLAGLNLAALAGVAGYLLICGAVAWGVRPVILWH
jgi:4-amino-4-deoxy-L-arabinose transferase-like glycosyltransferase